MYSHKSLPAPLISRLLSVGIPESYFFLIVAFVYQIEDIIVHICIIVKSEIEGRRLRSFRDL